MCYLKLLKLETLQLKLFETFDICLSRTKKFQLTLNLGVINLLVHRVDICC